jgi:hypothetical protein
MSIRYYRNVPLLSALHLNEGRPRPNGRDFGYFTREIYSDSLRNIDGSTPVHAHS